MSFAFDPTFRPRLLALPAMLARQGGEEGRTAGRLPGGRLEFREHRPYTPGDDLRDVDWNVFLRLDQLAVKDYSRGEAPEVAVVLDRSASMGAEGDGKDRLVRELAAGIAYAGLASGAPLTIYLLGPGGVNPVARHRSPRRLDAILSLLEGLGAPAGATGLDAIRRLPPATAAGRVAFVLSDFLIEPLPATLGPALTSGPSTAWLLHVVAAAERAPDLGRGPLTLEDPETGERLLAADPDALRSRYLEELASHEAEVAAVARRHGLGHLGVTDSEPFERAVLRCAGRGGPAG